MSEMKVRLPVELAEWLQAEAKRRIVSTQYLLLTAVERLRDQLVDADDKGVAA